MRRFKFGGSDSEDEQSGGEQAAEQPTEQSAPSQPVQGEEQSSRSWMSNDESEWVQPDQPAPVHGGEGAQTPQDKVAHEGPEGDAGHDDDDEDAVEPLSEQPKEGEDDTLSRDVPPPWEHQADRSEQSQSQEDEPRSQEEPAAAESSSRVSVID